MIQYGKQDLFYPNSVFAFGDVHGEYNKLCRLLDSIFQLKKPGDHVVGCGDYINRGPDSVRVLKKLAELKQSFPNEVHFIEGNHERMFKYFLEGDLEWMSFGGSSLTLDQIKQDSGFDSITVGNVQEWLKYHQIDVFLNQLIPYYESENVIITHAPLDKEICITKGIQYYEEEYKLRSRHFTYFLERLGEAIFWNETVYIDYELPLRKFQISGHQFVKKIPSFKNNRVFIDTGCGLAPNNPLSAVIFPAKKYIQVR